MFTPTCPGQESFLQAPDTVCSDLKISEESIPEQDDTSLMEEVLRSGVQDLEPLSEDLEDPDDQHPGLLKQYIEHILSEKDIESTPRKLGEAHLEWSGAGEVFDPTSAHRFHDLIALASEKTPNGDQATGNSELESKFDAYYESNIHWNDVQRTMFKHKSVNHPEAQQETEMQETSPGHIEPKTSYPKVDRHSRLHYIPSIVTTSPTFFTTQERLYTFLPEEKKQQRSLDMQHQALQDLQTLTEVRNDGNDQNHRYQLEDVKVTEHYDPANTVSTTYLKHINSLGMQATGLFSEHTLKLSNKMKATGSLVNGVTIQVLFDTGATVSLVSRKLVELNNNVLKPLVIPKQRIVLGDGREYLVEHACRVMLNIDGHLFEIIAWIIPMSSDLDFVFGMQSMVEEKALLTLDNMNFTLLPEQSW